MPSRVSDPSAASPDRAAAFYAAKLSFETDCWDVHQCLADGTADFVLIDVRSPALYAKAHVAGALSLPHGKITARRMFGWPAGTLFVVYCAGPHCNGADKAALRIARLGGRVKAMIGGLAGWMDEGLELARGPAAP